MSELPDQHSATRRRFLAVCSAAGLGHTLFPGALLALATQAPASEGAAVPASDLQKITPAMIEAASAIAGLRLTEEQRAMMLDGLKSQRESVLAVRALDLPNSVAPAFVFDPVPAGTTPSTNRVAMRMSAAPEVKELATGARASAQASAEERLAFATVRELAELLRSRKAKSVDLTKLYLARLRKYDSRLHFVITLTEARALEQGLAADREIAAGHYRGPLHGIPWGAKDLLAVKGYPTTWGAGGFEQQSFEADATVVERLDRAGAVLVAKLSMGALAQGDLWFGARTRNPWNPRQGSSGSSAGSASAVSAGCVGFAIGTETLGSISSPSTRCGTTGLRPSFGFVPRTGAMALSWTMDKIGPICRAVEDCALVMDAIHGPDGHDRTVKDAAFNWDASLDVKRLRVGYLKSAFDAPTLTELTPPSESDPKAEAEYKLRVQRAKDEYTRRLYDAPFGERALGKLRDMGVALRPVEMPKFPFTAIVPVLEAEAAAAFEQLTLSGRDRLLTGQRPFDWPNQFRVAHMYSAVDYVQAMRGRTLAMEAMAKLFADFDIIVAPSGGVQLSATNLTGQPAVIVPNGVRGDDAPRPVSDADGAPENVGGPGTPVSLTFLGPLYSDARVLAFARMYQEATGFHKLHPRLS